MSQTKRYARIAIMASFYFATFFAFSNILYLEAITLMVVCVGLVFDFNDAFLSAVIFGFLLVLYFGPTPWSIMYLAIYPLYSFLSSKLKKILLKSQVLLTIFGALLSFSTGMLLDLPFILVSKTVTMLYILSGLKTSIIQGAITAVEFILVSEPLLKALTKIKER